jgi:hypothetical protein
MEQPHITPPKGIGMRSHNTQDGLVSTQKKCNPEESSNEPGHGNSHFKLLTLWQQRWQQQTSAVPLLFGKVCSLQTSNAYKLSRCISRGMHVRATDLPATTARHPIQAGHQGHRTRESPDNRLHTPLPYPKITRALSAFLCSSRERLHVVMRAARLRTPLFAVNPLSHVIT